MTTRDAIRCYIAAFPDDTEVFDLTDLRRASIANEVRRIVTAESMQEAKRAIMWWRRGGWEDDELARVVNAIRAAAGVPGFK